MFFDKLKSVIKTPEIEFLCFKEDLGIIPEPIPAKKFIPDWFKALPPKVDNKDKLNAGTVKRCLPFLDAMSVGWLIPLVADVEFVTNADASGLTYKCLFDRELIESHGFGQVTTDKAPNPNMPKPPMKFLNWWAIRVPKGYSVLFVPPLNRQDPRFTCMSGFVDCDGYFEFINFPFFFNQPNYTGIIEAGTPMVQAIPIKRDALLKNHSIGPLTTDDIALREKTRKLRRVHEAHYHDNVRVKK